jgi:hypothetical protein
MNDLDLIRDLRPAERLAGLDELAPARGQLAAAIATEISAEAGRGNARRRPAVTGHPAGAGGGAAGDRSTWPAGRRRLALAGVAVAAVAAAVAAILVVVPSQGGQPPTSPASGPASNAVSLTAARFLNAAARAVLRQPAQPPSPHQWVYSETEGANGAKTQTWLPADGSQDGISRGPQGGPIPACTVAQAETKRCLPDAGYFPDLPTNPKLLFAYLDKVQIAEDTAPPNLGKVWLANQLAKGVSFLLQQTYLRPAQRAALFELMAQTPGFTVVHGVADAIGRVGVAVEWNYGGKGAVIFDPRTYAYLGVRTWPSPGFHGPGANQYDGNALITLAIVNSPPPGVSAGRSPTAHQVKVHTSKTAQGQSKVVVTKNGA